MQNRREQDKNLDSVSSFEFLFSRFNKQELVQIRKIIDSLIDEKEKKILIPISIFSTGLNAVEALTKYLKENLNLKYSEIAKLLNKKQNTIWINYHRAVKKLKNKFIINNSKLFIPLEKINNKKLSLVEALIVYLRDSLNLKNKECASLLNTSEPVLSSAYHRAKSKLKQQGKFNNG